MSQDDCIFYADSNIPFLPESLSNLGEVNIYYGRAIDRGTVKRATALFARSTIKINADLLAGSAVRFAATATSGTDHVDEAYLESRGIAFASAPGSNANSVAEYVIYSILKFLGGASAAGQTLGVVGFGNIGRIVSRFAHYLNMRVLVSDPPLERSGFPFPGYVETVPFNDVVKYSSIVTNHVPLTAEGADATKNLFSREVIETIPTGALFIHASRGEVVDEAALLDRLKRKELVAAVDVWEREPDFNPELARRCILATPHVAGHSYDGKLRGSVALLDAYKKFSQKMPDYSKLMLELSSYSPMPRESYRETERIFRLLAKRRLFELDTLDLLNLAGKTEKERREGFDFLRKNYPARRESL